MLSYKLGNWRADPVIEAYQSLSQRVGQQVFISELTQDFYFPGHRRAVSGSGDEAKYRWQVDYDVTAYSDHGAVVLKPHRVIFACGDLVNIRPVADLALRGEL